MWIRRIVLSVVVIAQLVVLAFLVREWAYVTTYRLYLDHSVGGERQSAVTQRFEIESRRVVPLLIAPQPARISFNRDVGPAVTVQTELRPSGPVNYAIAWRTDAGRQVLAAGRATDRTAIVRPVPVGAGVLELETDGPATWSDPRVVRGLSVSHPLELLLVLVFASWILSRADAGDRAVMRITWFRIASVTTTFAVGLCACEVTLRALGDRAPAGLLAQRHHLGDVTPDPRWEDSSRYGRRLQAGVNAENEWRYGDIVRMGFVSSAMSPGVLRRFPFKTDAEGFRNPAVRERVNIAALGDSFTDAMTIAVDASWPTRLERRLGVPVQNYGTAGFGPQQELLVLRDFVVPHHPSTVILAYFAGNDIFDAERFELFEQARGRVDGPDLGWPIKTVYDRADTWFVTSALQASAGWFFRDRQPFVVTASAAEPPRDPEIPAQAPFDRGLFSLHVEGHLLQWAFMPPYLNTLNFSERELRSRRGWQLTRESILAMQQTSRDAGAQFVVMFLPFKAQVYWPLLERSVTPDELHGALSFYLKDNGRAIDVGAMRRNRLAQNTMMRELCASAGIPFLDTTPVLQEHIEHGENVYFPDESHLNEIGQGLVADALAGFLQRD